MARKLTAKQELFCRYYILGSSKHNLRLGNATQSYALAYYNKLVEQGDKEYYTCGKGSSDNLKKPKIKARIKEIKEEAGWNDDAMDSRLREIAFMSGEPSASVSAIREFNRVMGRIIDKQSLVDDKGNDVFEKILKDVAEKGSRLKPSVE